MELKNVIKSAFKDIVKAQYEAYLYSLELKGGQDDDELFPIPIVKATELTFDLQYAYVGDPEEKMTAVFSKKAFLKDVRAASYKVVREGINALVGYIEQNKSDKTPQWETIKTALSKKELPYYVVELIMKEFKTNFDTLVTAQNELNKKFFENTITSNFDTYVIDHFDLKPLKLTPGDKQWLSYAIQPELTQQANELNDSMKQRVVQKLQQKSNIVVDAEALKKLPRKSIQHITLHVKVDEMDEIKVS